MRIKIIAVGTKIPDWVAQGTAEYLKRMPVDLKVEIREIPLAKRGRDNNPEVACHKEGELILAAIPAGDNIIALDVHGRSWSTETLAKRMEGWRMSGSNYSLLIGGPDGLSPACVNRAQELWSLSELTLPHPLVRVLLTEQIYRAWTIINHHPYHR